MPFWLAHKTNQNAQIHFTVFVELSHYKSTQVHIEVQGQIRPGKDQTPNSTQLKRQFMLTEWQNRHFVLVENRMECSMSILYWNELFGNIRYLTILLPDCSINTENLSFIHTHKNTNKKQNVTADILWQWHFFPNPLLFKEHVKI